MKDYEAQHKASCSAMRKFVCWLTIEGFGHEYIPESCVAMVMPLDQERVKEQLRKSGLAYGISPHGVLRTRVLSVQELMYRDRIKGVWMP
jgi:hypothetical protein